MAKRLDGVHQRGAAGGIDPEDHGNGDGDGEGNGEGREGQHGLHVGCGRDGQGDQCPEYQTDHAAGEGEDEGLHQELQHDVAAAGAERAADADLTGALADGGEHDIHDANTADDQRDGRDGAKHDVE